MEGNLRFKIDWASLIVGRKFNVFTLFYFVFEANFRVQAPGRAHIWRGDLTEGFLRYEVGGLYTEGLIFGILRYPDKTENLQTLRAQLACPKNINLDTFLSVANPLLCAPPK